LKSCSCNVGVALTCPTSGGHRGVRVEGGKGSCQHISNCNSRLLGTVTFALFLRRSRFISPCSVVGAFRPRMGSACERRMKKKPTTAAAADDAAAGLEQSSMAKPPKQRKQTRDADSTGVQLKVCGPAYIQTLRGTLLGREVALILCGEAHEDAIDLTRQNCVVESEEGWVPMKPCSDMGFDPEEAVASQDRLTLQGARSWAERIIDKMDDDSDAEDTDGSILLFEPDQQGQRGTASLFPNDAARDVVAHPLSKRAVLLEWADLDAEAWEFNRRRMDGEEVPEAEHDALIAARKIERRKEGVELFDDWLLRHACCDAAVRVEIVLEAPVPAREVELHVETDASPAPAAHECLRVIELDSDEDSDEENDPDDGTGAFIDYLRRRVESEVPAQKIHSVDPRDLGDAEDPTMRASFQELLLEPLPADVEEAELNELGAELAVQTEEDDESESDPGNKTRRRKHGRKENWRQPVPSWEAYFGAASELLYYSPYIKGDYAPFLAGCVGSPASLRRFFKALYFGTVPEAIALLQLEGARRPLSRLRSLAYQPPQPGTALQRRPNDQGMIPVRAAPLDCYLKAKGSYPPRTWVSGVAERLRQASAGDLVAAAEAWYTSAVESFLADPKTGDNDGDYFIAWLREVHRNIFDDIDRTDPEEIVKSTWAKSQAHPKSKKHRHKLGDITIPDFDAAFAELKIFGDALAKGSKRSSTKRERVLAKMLVDIYQLRLVDLAMILSVADCALAVETGQRVVVVLYAGGDHTKSLTEFWRSRGFGNTGLPNQGLVGKEDWEDDEPRGLSLPSYLHDFARLFPVPPMRH